MLAEGRLRDQKFVGDQTGRTVFRLVNKAYLALLDARANLAREEGQALVEYALILALITVVTIAVLEAMGVSVAKILGKVSTSLSSVAA
jgi:pilus assembly protein Flp/PilA